MKRVAQFASEAELCEKFIDAVMVPKNYRGEPLSGAAPEWTAYPETGGFDILLVRRADGFQIGVEAKLRLNEVVIRQALEGRWAGPGPDCRAVLVPAGSGLAVFDAIADYTGITVIRCRESQQGSGGGWYSSIFDPPLPKADGHYGSWSGAWHEQLLTKRIALPEYVPDVRAGVPAPATLSHWKIGALKIAALLETRGFVTKADFKHVGIDHRRWQAQGWLTIDRAKAAWVRGQHYPDFAGQHPVNYAQIKADYEKWKPEVLP